MKTLTRKLLRDLLELKIQAITISLVVGAGISVFIASQSAYDSLLKARDLFYAESRFCQGFVSLRSAPESLVRRLTAIPGMAIVRSRIVQEAVLDFPGEPLPSAGRFVSLTEGLNMPSIRSGRMPASSEEVLLSEAFALANRLTPGDHLTAILNGKKKTLIVSGTALSPEYVYVFRGASPLPDDRHYGILWMQREALESAFQMKGAFNDVIFTYAPGASVSSLLKNVDREVEPYGGIGAYDRSRLASHSFLLSEFQQLRTTAYMVPGIFLGVAAFLLHIVSTRIVSKEREQIATLKAVGYANSVIALHYGKLISVISMSGALLGVLGGYYLGDAMTGLYGEFYRFPDLRFRFEPVLALYGIVIGLGAGAIGVSFSMIQVMRLQPAQAMRPPVPATFRFSPIERLFVNFPVNFRMVLRHLFQRPLRTVLSVLGVATAVMVMVIGTFSFDSMNLMMDIQFNLLQRESVTVSFLNPVSSRATTELSSEPGVLFAEGYRVVPVRIRAGHRSRELALLGLPASAEMRRLVDSQRQIVPPPADGILLNSGIAKKLGLHEGQTILLEVLEGNRKKVEVKITGTIEEMLGQAAYMEIRSVNRLLSEGESINLIALRTDPAEEAALLERLKEFPKVAGVSTRSGFFKIFRETMSRSVLATTVVLLGFAIVISVGVVYNTAMIALSERAFELGSLRILGFTKTEVFQILAGELTVTTVLALPVGCLLGYAFAYLMLSTVNTEEFSVPLVISGSTYGQAVLTTIATMAISYFILYRRIRSMDLIGILKVRE